MTMRRRRALAALGSSLGLAACGGGPDASKARLRFVNASSGYAALDLRAADVRRFEAIAYGGSASYREIDPDEAELDITLPGSATALISSEPDLRKDRPYTLLAFGAEGALQSLLLEDRETEADSGKVKLRVVNASPDAGPLDIFFTGAADGLAGANPLHTAVEVGEPTDFSTLASGNWRLRVTAAGVRADLRLDLTNVELPSRGVVTLVLTSTVGGMLVHALQLEQEGGIVRRDNTQARVRAALPNAQTATVRVGGVALMNAVTGPAIEAYKLVDAGVQAVLLEVDGVVFNVPSVQLAPGTEQTLLVYRQNFGTGTRWLSDDNRAPSATGRASVRLVHGRDGSPTPLSLKVDLQPVGNAVDLPGASAYGLVPANAEARVSITALGDPQPLYEASSIELVAGAVYSVLAVEGVPPDAGFVRRDR